MEFYTEISKNNMDYLMNECVTAQDLVQFLKSGAKIRSFGDVLRAVYPKEDISERLMSGMAEMEGSSSDSLRKQIPGWLKGEHTPPNREKLFQICFCLGLDEPAADRILCNASDTGIHYRNPWELICAFCLRTGKNYQDALKLKERLASYIHEPSGYKKLKRGEEYHPEIYTRHIKSEFSQVTTEKDLEKFFQEYEGTFGVYHETAYEKFLELSKVIQEPGEGEHYYSADKVIAEYLQMGVPKTKKLEKFSVLQKLVKKSWPNTKKFQEIKARKQDVDRKVLLLLYIITGACDQAQENVDDEPDEKEADILMNTVYEDDDLETRVEVRLDKLNLFLTRYGMNSLDPGNVFDYLVMFSLMAQEDETTEERMNDVIQELFAHLEASDQ